MAGGKQFVHCREVVLLWSVHYLRFYCIHTASETGSISATGEKEAENCE